MPQSWIGPARYLFIPLVIEDTPGVDPPPADFVERIHRKVFFDPDQDSSEDNSLLSYINSVSYGRASIDATIADPVTARNLTESSNGTLLAINANPQSHLFEYLAVVFPPNRVGYGSGMAQPGQIAFDPPRSPNVTRARSRFRLDDVLGTWAMEILHNVTDIGDYYNGVAHPGDFDEMAGAGATHPSAYTKLVAGWVDQSAVPWHSGGARNYSLYSLGVAYPPAGPRMRGVRVRSAESERYLVVEARRRADRWDGGSFASSGIPSEGVVVYEFSPESDPWPKVQPGPWPPLELRAVLQGGDEYIHPATGATITVRHGIPGGYSVRINTWEVAVPFVQEFPAAAAASRIRQAGLDPDFAGNDGANAWVWRQTPGAGTVVTPGSRVILHLRTGPLP